MAFPSSIFALFFIVHLALADQQNVHKHDFAQSDYSSKSNDEQMHPGFEKTTQKISYHSNQQNQVPVRWRSSNDYKLDNTKDFIELKYEESQRRIIRIRTLTTQQNRIQKQIESNETLLNEQMKKNNLEIQNIQTLANAIRNCINQFDRIQIELQKLYRDQIFAEKQLLEHYRTIKPTDLDLHKQLRKGIERWELIYNQLLDIKSRNQDREKKFDTLLKELEILQTQRKQSGSFLSKSSFQSSISNPLSSKQTTSTLTSSYSSTEPSKFSNSYSISYPQDQTKLSSSLSSSSYISSGSTYSSNLKSTDTDQNAIYSNNLERTGKISPYLEENKLIFRRPEFKDIKCLDKWWDDLGKEDAEWIAKNQLNNENFFKELVRLQKLQWDTLKVLNDEKKEKNIPQKYICELDKQDLCEQEEANFKKKFNEYRIERYPGQLDGLDQNTLNQLNFKQQQEPVISYSSNQHSNYNK